MKKGKEIADELKGIAPGMPLLDTPAYSVPEGYFDALPGMIMQRLEATPEQEDLSPLLTGLSRKMPDSVPEGYFDTLPDLIMQRLKAEMPASSSVQTGLEGLPALKTSPVQEELPPVSSVQAELEELSPLLAGISREMPYTVPAGYFDNLTVPVPGAKVIPMGNSRMKWLKRGLAAACVAAILAVGGMYLAKQQQPQGVKLDTQLAALSDQEIEDYLQNHTDDFDNEAIFSSVSNETELPSVIPDDISDANLEQYLDENMLKEVPFN